jgi:hypothetical protein
VALGTTLVASVLGNGVLLVGASSAPGHQAVFTLHAYLKNCAPDVGFGRHGLTRITYPVTQTYSFVEAMAPAAGGGVLLAGENGTAWVVGRLGPNGLLDAAFGDHGWAKLQPPQVPGSAGQVPTGPVVTSVVQAPSGRIYVGGNNGDAHCCVQSLVAGLTPTGHPDPAFGHNGWVDVFSPGSYQADLLVQPGGDLLVLGDIVFTGCGGPVLAMLTPDGTPVRTFDASASQSLGVLEKAGGLLVATVYPRAGGGIGLVGNESSSCATGGTPERFGVAAVLGQSGVLDPTFGAGGQARFGFDNAATVWVVPTRSGGTGVWLQPFQTGPSSVSAPLLFREFSTGGVPNEAFGRNGVTSYDLARAALNEQYPSVRVLAGPGRTAVIVVGSSHGIVIDRRTT